MAKLTKAETKQAEQDKSEARVEAKEEKARVAEKEEQAKNFDQGRQTRNPDDPDEAKKGFIYNSVSDNSR